MAACLGPRSGERGYGSQKITPWNDPEESEDELKNDENEEDDGGNSELKDERNDELEKKDENDNDDDSLAS
ncbi:MAG: hypothetical protein KDM64_15535 [Verrucomicrobiae bacterium]|nr:hypothetical protein [Verrucomicrobiae bacterium]